MFNDYYLIKKIEEKKGELSFASAMDSFTYTGEVIEVPVLDEFNRRPQIGDKVIFLKGSGEDVGEHKAVKFEDIIMKI
jgi:hypothetical protein